MVSYSLTKKAEADIAGIYEYTILKFGLEQARKYFFCLHDLFQSIAGNPMIGRSVGEINQAWRCLEYNSHIVFYIPKSNGVRIIRILHQSMDAGKHL